MQLNIYYVQIDVSFSKALKVSNARGCFSSGSVKGFVQEFGYTAPSVSEARTFIRQLISDELGFEDGIEISFDRIGLIKEHELENEVYSDLDIVNSASFANPAEKGMWYRSGRAFYE